MNIHAMNMKLTVVVGADWTLHRWRHNSSNVGGVTAGQARHNSSNVVVELLVSVIPLYIPHL